MPSESTFPHPLITLLTDFGTSDSYAGTMKGVMLGICPAARLVDLTHTIQPQNIRQAAFELLTAAPFFPKNTVHLVVVDPGVGSSRRAIAVEAGSAFYVAPDNGVLSYILEREKDCRAVSLENPDYQLPDAGSTFHGRDIFSPAAAHLANGVPLEALGPPVEDLVSLPQPLLEMSAGRISGEVLTVDHFGNLRTSLMTLSQQENGELHFNPALSKGEQAFHPLSFPGRDAVVTVAGQTIQGISKTFADAAPGEVVAYIGSAGGLEIGINQGDFAGRFGTAIGDRVTLKFVSP